MAYVINTFDGAYLTTIEDGTVDQTLDIKLIGKNYAGYGEIQNENFVQVLENFANSSAPPKAIRGQIWYDTTNKKIKFFTGDTVGGLKIWKTAGGVDAQGTEPSNPTLGDLWFDTARSQLKVRTSSNWLTVGPQTAGTGVTQMISRQLLGTDANLHSVIAATINDEVVYITSKDEFTIDITNTDSIITGFNGTHSKNIKKGITLPYADEDGISSTSHVYWGTSANSLLLNGKSDTDFISSINSQFATQVSFADAGYVLGDSDDLAVFIESGTNPIIKNTTGATITFRVTSSGEKTPLELNGTAVLPGATTTYTLGSTSRVWSNVYATTFTGAATQSDSLKVGTDYRTASTSAGINTIAARDPAGNITANLFSGVATHARYADLAEKYSADAEYEVGTVLVVGGTAEVTASSLQGQRAVGVVSENPAYLMNKDLAGGTAVALKGRVPVRVLGPVTKGDRLSASVDGTAQVLGADWNVFAIALEYNSDPGIKLVECVIL